MTQETLNAFLGDALSQLSFLREMARQKDHELGEYYNNGYADGFAQCIGLLNDHLSHKERVNKEVTT